MSNLSRAWAVAFFGLAMATTTPHAQAQATTESPAPGAAPAYQPPRERDAAGNIIGPERAGWWNDVVFYQVFVRSFADSKNGELANDGIGDIRGLIDKLDYLNDGNPSTTSDLGIGGIWLMPMTESPSYHGYDVVDYRTIERDYGTNDDFKRLINECHKRNIKVIIDLVMNHTSSKFPTFIEAADPKSPKHDWFIWSDTDPAYKGPWGQKVWHSLRGGKGPYYYGLFGRDMPDLNYHNKSATDDMLDIVKFWAADEQQGGGGFNLDGYRLDAIRHLIEEGRQQDNTHATHQWLKDFRKFYKDLSPDLVCVGEVWSSTESASSYVGDQLDMAFEFDLAAAIVDSAKSGNTARVRTAQEKVLKWYPPNQYGRFLTNHDQPRIMSQLKSDAGAMRAAAAMLLLGPGVPFIYYGEEIGMFGDKPDPDIRTPMQWTSADNAGFSSAKPWRSVNKEFQTLNVDTQSSQPESLLALYKQLIALRREHPALAHGAYLPVDSGNNGVYAFLRQTQQQSLLVVINLTNKPVSEYALAANHSALSGTSQAFDLITQSQSPVKAEASTVGKFTAFKPLAILAPNQVAAYRITSHP